MRRRQDETFACPQQEDRMNVSPDYTANSLLAFALDGAGLG